MKREGGGQTDLDRIPGYYADFRCPKCLYRWSFVKCKDEPRGGMTIPCIKCGGTMEMVQLYFVNGGHVYVPKEPAEHAPIPDPIGGD